jgi:hypothetical protein
VLSEDNSTRRASPPVLSRSSTTSFLPHLKPEPSESSQRPASRGNLQKSVSFSNREIDLVGDAKAQDAKRRKLAQLAAQKRELDAAIDALKKPNRVKAGQSIMDEKERRAADKSANRVDRQAVQIIATPKRKSNTTLSIESSLPMIEVPVEEPLVPSSTMRARQTLQKLSCNRPSSTTRAVLAAVQNTPSRATMTLQKHSPLPQRIALSDGLAAGTETNLVEAISTNSRLQTRSPLTQVEATPLRMTKSQKPVLFTPVRKNDISVEDAFRDAPVITKEADKAMDRVMRPPRGVEVSLYDSLGWNDDFEC